MEVENYIMGDPVSLSGMNPFAGANLGGSMGTMGSILMVVAISVVILVLVGALIYWKSIKKKYWIKIPVYRLVGNVPTRVATFEACEVPFGMAGDKLWRVTQKGWNKFKVVKWLSVGKIQSASSEFWYFIREDGEWINFQMADLNKISKDMGIKFVQEDMRLQRLATERLLEQRLMNKTFWEKWGTTIMMIVVFLVISVCMVIMFFQWSKLLDKMAPIIETQAKSTALLIKYCGSNYLNATSGGTAGLVPA